MSILPHISREGESMSLSERGRELYYTRETLRMLCLLSAAVIIRPHDETVKFIYRYSSELCVGR
jgi:hypothetical protein